MTVYNVIVNIAKITAAVLSLAVTDYVIRRIMNYIDQNEETEIRDEVIFFSDKCRSATNLCNVKPCGRADCVYYKIRKLVKFIECAEQTLDICMLVITHHQLTDAVIKAHNQGAKVRVVADYGMSKEDASRLHLLDSEGIPVRLGSPDCFMHNKFAVVDHKILITGSFNWTLAAVVANWEHLIVTSDPNPINLYTQHFSELWKDCEMRRLN